METVRWDIEVEGPITPKEPLPSMPDIPRGAVVVVEGPGPIWRYGMALHKLHGSPAAVVAVFDPRLGPVVVMSHRPDIAEGDILEERDRTEEMTCPDCGAVAFYSQVNGFWYCSKCEWMCMDYEAV